MRARPDLACLALLSSLFACASPPTALEEVVSDDAGAPTSRTAPDTLQVAGPSPSSLGNVLGASPAAIVDSSFRINVFVITSSGVLATRKQLTPTGDFAAWQTLGSGFALIPPVVAKNQDGKLQLFAVAADGSLRTAQQTSAGGAWGAWTSLGGFTSHAPAVGQNLDGRLEVFVVGSDRAVYHKWQGAPSGAFSPTWAAFGGVSRFTPAVSRTFDGKMDVFVVGDDGALRHRLQTGPNIAFGPWLAFGGNAAQQPLVGRNLDGRLDVFVVGPTGRISHRSQASTSGTWNSNWHLLSAGAAPTAHLVSAALNKQGRLEILGTRSDGVPFHRLQNTPVVGAWGAVADDAWGDENVLLGLVGTGAITGVTNYEGAVQVFVRGSDNRLFHMLTMGRYARPDMLVEILHPLTGCLDGSTADSVRSRLADAIETTYPGYEILDRCRDGATTFGVYTEDVPAAGESRARTTRLSALGLVHARVHGQLGIFFDERFLLEHTRRVLGLPQRYDREGGLDPNGEVLIEHVWDVDFLGWNIVRTELIGEVEVPFANPDFEMTILDTMRIENRKPTCTSTANVRIDNPDWRLHLVPIAGTVIHEVAWSSIDESRGPRDAPEGGGTGCSVVSSLPRELLVDLGVHFRTLKLDLLYDTLEVSVQGVHAAAAMQLVPRAPTVSIRRPLFVFGAAQFGIRTDDLRGALAIRWESSGAITSPFSESTEIRFPTTGTHWVRVTVTDVDGGTATQQISVVRIL